MLELEAALRTLNLGVEAWTLMGEPSGSRDEFGYAKTPQKWCFLVRSTPPNGTPQEWSFSDAPRALRAAAIGKLQDFFATFATAVSTHKATYDSALVLAKAIATAVNRHVPGSKPTSEAGKPPASPAATSTTPQPAESASPAKPAVAPKPAPAPTAESKPATSAPPTATAPAVGAPPQQSA